VLEPYPSNHAPAAHGVLHLGKPPDAGMLTDFEKIFNEWSEKIE